MRDFLSKRLGRNVSRARSEAGISQEVLAERASLHKNIVGEVERGGRVPQLDTFLKLASGLGLSPQQLLAGIEWDSEAQGFRDTLEPASTNTPIR
jgi:transcriptional regulator with XRE-family HTH domain